MITKVVITPKFNVTNWVRKNLERDWFEIQEKVYNLGNQLHAYMITYIKTHKKRTPSTGNLERAIDLKIFSLPAQVGFGIGNLQRLQALAPYWYVLNYGKKVTGERFIPGGRQWRPVRFGNNSADSNLRGHGTQKATIFAPIGGGKIPNYIRPINYIQATQLQMGRALRTIIPKSAMPGQLRGTRGLGGARSGGVWRT